MRRRWLPVPGQQLGQPVDRMDADAGDDAGQPGFGLDAVHARCADERVERGGASAARIRTTKQPIFASQSRRADLVFCGIGSRSRDDRRRGSALGLANAIGHSGWRGRDRSCPGFWQAARQTRSRVRRFSVAPFSDARRAGCREGNRRSAAQCRTTCRCDQALPSRLRPCARRTRHRSRAAHGSSSRPRQRAGGHASGSRRTISWPRSRRGG